MIDKALPSRFDVTTCNALPLLLIEHSQHVPENDIERYRRQ